MPGLPAVVAVCLAAILAGRATCSSPSPAGGKRLAGYKWQAQLYDDLMYDYNKMPRPVQNASDIVTIEFAASIIRIIDVDEKNQVFTTNLWLEMKWVEPRLVWKPADYDGIEWVHIPSTEIWTPDIVLYNNAAGDPDITIQNDITVRHDGNVTWKPPAIYKSFCQIDVTWFPYDFQRCNMKFGTWSYTGDFVNLILSPRESVDIELDPNAPAADAKPDEFLMDGMDISYFYQSAEWDLLNITAWRHEVVYDSCCGPEKYVDVTFRFLLRRKTLFYTCNLIIPCFLISFLTSFVFYLSDKKITFAISILVCVTVFFLILIEIMPPTSLVVPMFGKYLLTTICLLTVSIFVSVISVNFYFRTGRTHKMSNWIRVVFMRCLPRLLHMEPPRITVRDVGAECAVELLLGRAAAGGGPQPNAAADTTYYTSTYDKLPTVQCEGYFVGARRGVFGQADGEAKVPLLRNKEHSVDHILQSCDAALNNLRAGKANNANQPNQAPLEIANYTMDNLSEREHEVIAEHALKWHKAVVSSTVDKVKMIAEHFRTIEYEQQLSDEWRFVSQVIDRIFLLIFIVLNVISLTIIVQAPSLYDTREPLKATTKYKPLSHTEI